MPFSPVPFAKSLPVQPRSDPGGGFPVTARPIWRSKSVIRRSREARRDGCGGRSGAEEPIPRPSGGPGDLDGALSMPSFLQGGFSLAASGCPWLFLDAFGSFWMPLALGSRPLMPGSSFPPLSLACPASPAPPGLFRFSLPSCLARAYARLLLETYGVLLSIFPLFLKKYIKKGFHPPLPSLSARPRFARSSSSLRFGRRHSFLLSLSLEQEWEIYSYDLMVN